MRKTLSILALLITTLSAIGQPVPSTIIRAGAGATVTTNTPGRDYTIGASGGAGSATNAVATVSTNGTAFGTSATNIDFWNIGGITTFGTNRAGHSDITIGIGSLQTVFPAAITNNDTRATTLAGVLKLNAPTNATTVVNLGLDANGNVSSNAVPVGASGGGQTPIAQDVNYATFAATNFSKLVGTNGGISLGTNAVVASGEFITTNKITITNALGGIVITPGQIAGSALSFAMNVAIAKANTFVSTNLVQIGSPATADNGQLLLYGTNGHLARLNGINVEGVDQVGFSFQLDSLIAADFGTNHFAFLKPILITNTDGRIITAPTNLFEVRTTNAGFFTLSNDMTLTLNGGQFTGNAAGATNVPPAGVQMAGAGLVGRSSAGVGQQIGVAGGLLLSGTTLTGTNSEVIAGSNITVTTNRAAGGLTTFTVATGGASQTPLAQDVNGAAFALTNLSKLAMTNGGISIGTNYTSIPSGAFLGTNYLEINNANGDILIKPGGSTFSGTGPTVLNGDNNATNSLAVSPTGVQITNAATGWLFKSSDGIQYSSNLTSQIPFANANHGLVAATAANINGVFPSDLVSNGFTLKLTLAGVLKLNAPTNAATVVNLGLDANGNVSSNAVPIGGSGSQTPLTADVNGATFAITNTSKLVETNGYVSVGTNVNGGSGVSGTLVGTNYLEILNAGGGAKITGASNWLGGFTTTTQLAYPTNSGAALTPDFSKSSTWLTTNAAFTVLAPVNVNPTNWETTTYFVTNSTAAVVAITAPTNMRSTSQTNGTWNVTNLTVITFMHYGGYYTNGIALPLY